MSTTDSVLGSNKFKMATTAKVPISTKTSMTVSFTDIVLNFGEVVAETDPQLML